MAQAPPPRTVVILGTGGTISGVADDPSDNLGYVTGRLAVGDLIASLPAGAARGLQLESEQIAQVDSKDMSFAIWLDLLKRVAHWSANRNVCGLVISHGTDTLEETAYFLHRVLAADKPVVLTCAMRPASSTLRDGPQNLADAISVAATPGARGVLVACAGVLHAAPNVQKMHTYRLDAFGSGDAGPLGYVEEGRLRSIGPWPLSAQTFDPALLPAPDSWPRVEVLLNHVHADGRLALELMQAGVKGIVVAGTGNGSLSAALEGALALCVSAGIRVLRTTRCATGPLLPSPHDRFDGASGLSAVKARIELMLELMKDATTPGPAAPLW